MADDREVAQDRVAPLGQVVGHQARERGDSGRAQSRTATRAIGGLRHLASVAPPGLPRVRERHARDAGNHGAPVAQASTSSWLTRRNQSQGWRIAASQSSRVAPAGMTSMWEPPRM